MEIECKNIPPPNTPTVYNGKLSRFSKASNRFIEFNALLYCEVNISSNNESLRGSLYLIDNKGNPFSCIMLGSNDIIKESAKGSNAFSIIGKTGNKIVLKSSSNIYKMEWINILVAVIQGNSDLTNFSSSPSSYNNNNNNKNENSCKEIISNYPTPIIKGILLKKGNRIGQYVKRWFELIKGEGLFYAPYGDSPRESFQSFPIKGLSVTFIESKKQIIFPPTSLKLKGMILKCQRVNEFILWREAIEEECFLNLSINKENNSNLSINNEEIPKITNELKKEGITPLNNNEKEESNILISLTNAQETSLNSPESLINSNITTPPTESVNIFTNEELKELEDLQSDIPCCRTNIMEDFLESIGEKYIPTKNTPEIKLELKNYFEKCLPYGLEATLQRIRQGFILPIRKPYESVNEHIVLLDLDVERIRECLKNTLYLYGKELAVRNNIKEMDYILRVYTHVRKQLLIRMDIAAFCEQPNQNGLSLGVNGTINSLDILIFSKIPSKILYNKAEELWKGLFQALETFRLDFDVFDESEETIVEMEDALNKIYDWLQQNTPNKEEVEEEKDLR